MGERRVGGALQRMAAALVRSRAYAATALILMVSAVAVNGLTLAVFYAFTWHPLPYPHAARLVWVRMLMPAEGLLGYDVSPDMWRKIQASTRSELADSGLVALGTQRVLLRVDGSRVVARVSKTTPSIFSTLGVPPALGHWPTRSAGHAGGPREALISHQFWERTFGGRRSALGAELFLSRQSYRVVGVLPAHGTLPFARADVYIPLVRPLPLAQQHNINDFLFVRLRQSISLPHFNAELRRMAAATVAQVPARYRSRFAGFKLVAVSLHDGVVHLQGMASLRWVFLVAGLFLWLLAVVNLSHYALVRHRARLHETAVRMALGATRWGLSARLLGEQLPLGLVIWLVAVALAAVGIHWFSGQRLVGGWEGLLAITLNGPVVLGMLFLTGLGLLITVAVPLWQMDPTVLRSALGEGRGRTMSRRSRRLLQGLSILQISLAVGLLTGGLVSVVSLIVALHRPLGFDPGERVVARVILPQHGDPEVAWRRIIHHLDGEPYVSGAAFALTLPWSQGKTGGDFAARGQSGYLNIDWVTPGFFRVLDIPLLRGSARALNDTSSSSPNAILGRGACEGFFGKSHCVGRTLAAGQKTVRVAAAAAPVSWQLQPWSRTYGTIYLPINSSLYSLQSDFSGRLVVTLKERGEAYRRAVEDEIQNVIPGALVLRLQRYVSLMKMRARYSSDVAEILTVLAILGIVMTLAGLYAVQTYIGQTRIGEYRLHAVLGASSRDFRRMAAQVVVWQVVPGCLLGAGAGLFLVRLLGGFFYHAFSIAVWVAPVSVLGVGLASSVAIGWPVMIATRGWAGGTAL